MEHYLPEYDFGFVISVKFWAATESKPERVIVRRRAERKIYNRCTRESQQFQFETKMDEAHFFAAKYIKDSERKFTIHSAAEHNRMFLFIDNSIHKSNGRCEMKEMPQELLDDMVKGTTYYK